MMKTSIRKDASFVSHPCFFSDIWLLLTGELCVVEILVLEEPRPVEPVEDDEEDSHGPAAVLLHPLKRPLVINGAEWGERGLFKVTLLVLMLLLRGLLGEKEAYSYINGKCSLSKGSWHHYYFIISSHGLEKKGKNITFFCLIKLQEHAQIEVRYYTRENCNIAELASLHWMI